MEYNRSLSMFTSHSLWRCPLARQTPARQCTLTTHKTQMTYKY